MPDGSECEPRMKFVKTWLIQNSGRLPWNSDTFPVKLICIAGNISSENKYVDVANTKISETASISVELVAPANPGNYFSEWVLSCHSFQFGPRIWCSIEVIDPASSVQSSIAATDTEQTNMSKSCFVRASSRPTGGDAKSLSSLNVSMIDAFLNESQHQHQTRSRFTDDLDDDEFVVVPDCFDLTKKWKQHSDLDKELNELKRSMLDSQCNASFVNVDGEKKEEDIDLLSVSSMDQQLDQLTENVKKLSNNDLIMLDSTESNLGSSNNNSSAKNDQTADLTVDISVSPTLSQSQTDYLSYNPVTITENVATSSPHQTAIKHEVNSIHLIPLVPAKVVRNAATADLDKSSVCRNAKTSSSGNGDSKQQLESGQRGEKNADHLSTFDIMKNAFSNLQGPSYVILFEFFVALCFCVFFVLFC